MKNRSRTSTSRRRLSQSVPSQAPSSTQAHSEEVDTGHQNTRISQCREALAKAKAHHGVAVTALNKLRPTDASFDGAADQLQEASKKLLSARKSYLECARTI